MMLETEEFLVKFHHLPGNAIGERKKGLNLLLKNIPPDRDAIITALTPKNHLEELFKLESLLKLQRIPELVEILKSGDEHLIKKLLKNKWFCQKLVSALEENCDGFVANVFPSMSYVSKRRLLKKLAIYGNNLDTLFDEVNNHYGLHIAVDVLLGCTEAKIRSVVQEYKFDLTRFHHKLLLKKFNLSQQRFIKGKDRNRDMYVDGKGSIAAYDIMDKYTLYRKWGKRLTRKLLLNSKEFIIANATLFLYSLHSRTLVRTLGEDDFKRFYFKCWPISVDDFNGTVGPNKLQKQLGKRCYPLLVEGMKLLYNKSIYDYPFLVRYEMIETMEATEREKWVTIKKTDTNMIAYLKTSESIPVIKNKIKKSSSIMERETLIRLLVETCKINQDLNALANVAKYVSIRYRNDDKVLRAFLSNLNRYFDLNKFEQCHWKLIQSLLNIVRLKENDPYIMLLSFDISYVEFLFKQKKLKEGNLLRFIRTIKSMDPWYFLDKICDDLKKIILLKLIDVMPELMEEGDELHCYDLRTIDIIINWNRKHPGDQILVFKHPRLIDSLRKSFRDMVTIFDCFVMPKLFCIYKNTMEFIICKNEMSDLRDDALKTYFLLEHQFYDLKIDMWLLKTQPEIIAANFHKFMEHVTYVWKLDLKFIYWIKKYSYLALPEKAITFCLEKLRLTNIKGNKQTLFTILAILSSCEDFLQYVSPYYLSEDEMDVDEAEKEYRYDEKKIVAINVARSFKYTTNTDVLPTLMKYCKADFLNYSLESLYCLFYHLPENRLSAFLNNLSTKAVSVIKTTICLTCIVGNISTVKTLVTHFIEKECNIWLRKHLFSAAFKYFSKNPSDDLWKSVQIWLTKLDNNSNDERYEMTLNLLKEMPTKHQSSHVLFVWECWKKTDKYGTSSPEQLLDSISPEAIKDLPLQLILELIADNFFKNQYQVDEFIVSCLIKTNFKTEILKAMFDVVSKIKMMSMDEECEDFKQQKRDIIFLSNFVESCVKKIAIEERNEEILHLFSQKWYELCGDKETEVSEEHLQFTLGRFYCRFGGENLLLLNKVIMDYLKELTMTYGTGIVDVFAAVLQTTFDFYNVRDKAYFDLCMDIIARDELIFFLLVIQLLPKQLPSANEELEKFNRIIQMLRLRGTSTKLVLVYLNRYIKNVSFFECSRYGLLTHVLH